MNKYFNDSTGEGDEGERDARGPWNYDDSIEYVTAPARMAAQTTSEEVRREIGQAPHRVRRGAPKPRSRRTANVR